MVKESRSVPLPTHQSAGGGVEDELKRFPQGVLTVESLIPPGSPSRGETEEDARFFAACPTCCQHKRAGGGSSPMVLRPLISFH
ncbi:hypothetical protein EYF80_007386 [Liparis tanakae]|uniref:Uncharacterized protein n=1 Tax=Liparis tanakae TaxID=230148 RepID=A0A4Z2IWL3_9TELE|nr:hypothetical protein EYF80_007386 [Liparis tanakae]